MIETQDLHRQLQRIDNEAMTRDLEAYKEIESLRARVAELEAVIKSHGIPVKTAAGGKNWYCMGRITK